MKLLVVSETRFAQTATGETWALLGVDDHRFWRRYVGGAFEEVTVAARTTRVCTAPDRPRVDGPGVRVAALPPYDGWWGALQVRDALVTALDEAIRSADVLCLRAPGLLSGLAWRRRGEHPVGVEVVGDPRDAFAPGAVRSVVRPLARTLLEHDLRSMCAGARAVAYVTERVLQERYPTGTWSTGCSDIRLEQNAYVTPHEVRRRFVTRAHEGRGTTAAPWRLLFVGSLAQLYKGQDVLLDATAALAARGLPLVLTIAGDGQYRGMLETRATQLRAPVRFVGQIAAGDGIRDLLDQSDLFVLPSRTEGLPRAMLEAMARGIPSIGTSVGGMRELLPAARLVAPGDANALADAIGNLCSNPEALIAPALQDLERARRYRASILQRRWEQFLDALGEREAHEPVTIAAGGVA